MNKTTTNREGSKENAVKYTLCPEFMKLVHLVMDGEANEEEEKLFMAHIEANQDCQNHYVEEKEIRAILKEKCGNVPVPDQLIKLIQLKLQDIPTA
jgi:mycothiol system anti-sigma-R factor